MRKEQQSNGEEAAKTTKPVRPAAVPKPTLKMHDIEIPKDAEGTKQLTAIVKLLKEKNTPTKSTDITAIATKTIKAVEAAQKSGSAAFRREATKSLIELREVVSKSEVLSPKRMKTLLDRFDHVSLDAKNASFYMMETAKKQASDMKANAHEYAKNSKLQANTTFRSIVAAGELRAKAIASAAAKEASEKEAEAAADRQGKTKTNKENMADARAKNKLEMKNLQNAHTAEMFKISQELEAQKHLNDQKHDERMKELSVKESDRRQKHNDKNRDRVQRIRSIEEEHKKRMKLIEDEASSAAKIRKGKEKDAKNESKQAKKKLDAKKKARDERADKFNTSVMEGVYDANPLLKAGVNIFSGIHANVSRALDWNKDRKAKKANADSALEPVVEAPKEEPKIKVDQPRPSEVLAQNQKLQRVSSDGKTRLKKGEPPEEKLQRIGNEKIVDIPGRAANDGDDKPKLTLTKAPELERIVPAKAANDKSDKPLSPIMKMLSSLTNIIKQIGVIAKFFGNGLRSMMKTMTGKLFSRKKSSTINGGDESDEDQEKKPSLLKRAKNRFMSSKKSNLAKSEGSGVPSGAVGEGASAAEGVGGVVGEGAALAEGAGAAVEGGMGIAALVAGIAGLSEIILPVIAGVAAVAGVVTLAKSWFGGSDKDDSKGHDVVGKITSGAVAGIEKPSQSDAIAAKQASVDQLKDSVAAQSNNAGNVLVNTDNSVRSNNTTIIPEKLSTRNDDQIHQKYGYGTLAA